MDHFPHPNDGFECHGAENRAGRWKMLKMTANEPFFFGTNKKKRFKFTALPETDTVCTAESA